MSRLLLPALAFVLVAGCLQAATPGIGPKGHLDVRAAVLGVLTGLPAPKVDASATVSEWEAFVDTYPKRDTLLPHNQGAGDYLAAELAKAGFRVDNLYYPFEYRGPLPVPLDLPTQVRAIRGTLEGKDLTHRVALVAHYDTVTATAQGAYDDGSGTMMELSICRTLAAAKAVLHRSIDCLFFDAEEQGLVASRAYATWYAETKDRGFAYDLVLGYDMTGINWPGFAPWNLYAMIGTQHPDLAVLTTPFHDFLDLDLHEFLAAGPLPGADEGIRILEVHDRNSDEQSFKKIGIPVVRFAGGRNAADYPMYHQPGDTVPYVYTFAGGRPNYEKGVNAIVVSSYYTILGMDAFDPWHLPTA